MKGILKFYDKDNAMEEDIKTKSDLLNKVSAIICGIMVTICMLCFCGYVACGAVGLLMICGFGVKVEQQNGKDNYLFRPLWVCMGLLLVVVALFRMDAEKPLTARGNNIDDKSRNYNNIEGLYIVKADSYYGYKYIDFIACNTPETLKSYTDSILGDSEYNSVPGLMASGECVLLNNSYESRYSIRVAKVEYGIIKEIIRVPVSGAENKWYTDTQITADFTFNQNAYGEESRLREEQRIKDFFVKELNSVETTEVAAYLCMTSKDFNDLFYAHLNFDRGMPNTVLEGRCLKIKSSTRIKKVDIDKEHLWVKFEILDGEHSGKLLWGAP